MIFLNPLDAVILNIPFSFFAGFWVRVTCGAWGLVSVGFWGGGHQLDIFWGWEGVELEGCIDPALVESLISVIPPKHWSLCHISEVMWV